MLPILFSMKKSKKSSEKDSSAGALGDFEEFTGTVGYDDTVQGYDRTYTFTEKVKGMKIERKLRDDDQYQIINRRPKQLAYSATRTREKTAPLFSTTLLPVNLLRRWAARLIQAETRLNFARQTITMWEITQRSQTKELLRFLLLR